MRFFSSLGLEQLEETAALNLVAASETLAFKLHSSDLWKCNLKWTAMNFVYVSEIHSHIPLVKSLFWGGCNENTWRGIDEKTPSILPQSPAALRSHRTKPPYNHTRCTRRAPGLAGRTSSRAIISMHPHGVIDVVTPYPTQAAHQQPVHINYD